MIARSDGASSRGGFSDEIAHLIDARAEVRFGSDRDDAVAGDVLARHPFDGEHGSVDDARTRLISCRDGRRLWRRSHRRPG